jgi:hypothetical protein
VEAAAFHGRPVFFRLIGPWTKPERMREEENAQRQTRSVLVIIVGGTVLLGGIFLALRNYVRGRGDRRGAFRLGAFVFASHMLLWTFQTHLVTGASGFGLFLIAMGNALFGAALMWALYLAIEPYIRRHWPQAIISWSRLLAGRLRDPLLGRDLLIGVILGVVWLVIVQLSLLEIARRGGAPLLGATEYLRGGRHILGAWLGQVLKSVRGHAVLLLRALPVPRAAAAARLAAAASSPLRDPRGPSATSTSWWNTHGHRDLRDRGLRPSCASASSRSPPVCSPST